MHIFEVLTTLQKLVSSNKILKCLILNVLFAFLDAKGVL